MTSTSTPIPAVVRCEEEVFLTFTRKGCSWRDVASQAFTEMTEEVDKEVGEIEAKHGLDSTQVTWVYDGRGFGRREFEFAVDDDEVLYLADPDFSGGWYGLRDGDVTWVEFGSGSSRSTMTAWLEEDGTWTMQFQAPVTLTMEDGKIQASPYTGNYWNSFFMEGHALHTEP